MWQLKLFGGFQLEGADAFSGRAAQRKRQALLALLGSGPNPQISRDKIVALLWPETETERARHQLASGIYDARRLLGDDAILASGDDLRLNPDVVRSDVREFQAVLDQRDYARAAALRTGPFLDGFHLAGSPDFEHWVDGERGRLDRLFAHALEMAAHECNARGDVANAARWLQQLATHEPSNSRVALLYMDALAKSADAAGALRFGRTHQLLMQQEFGVSADAQISAFMDKLRTTSGEATPAPAITTKPSHDADISHSIIHPTKHSFLRRRVVGAAAAITLAAAVFALSARPSDPPERSIAVLPFSSIGASTENTYFADGVHEDLLAQLTRIPDLKVISRTSVMVYRDTQQNLRQIARDLDVAFVLEGSVRRDGNRIRVVAQLINARTDEHVWAETYERELTDLFAIQSDIAQAIARRLHAEVPTHRQAELLEPPTTVTEAYDEYLRARSLLYSTAVSDIDYPAAQQRLERAIQLDPKFALAYAELTRLHAGMIWIGVDASPERKAAAAQALDAATRLAPRRAETHLAAGYYHYWVTRNYQRALTELSQARVQMPGSAEIFHVIGLILRRRGQLDSAIHYFSNAAQLDPVRSLPYTYRAESLFALGRYAEANRVYQLALAKAPNDAYTLRSFGEMHLAWRGRTDTLRAATMRMSPSSRAQGGITGARFRVAMLERDCAAAAAAVEGTSELLSLHDLMVPRALYQAWAAECAGAAQQATRHYQEAERVARKMLAEHQPPNAAHISLAHALAGLGRREEAVAAAQKAISLMPYERDVFVGGYLEIERAAVYTRVGLYEDALDLLERYKGQPFGVSLHDLRLNPRWDALRGMPRFQRLAGSN